MLVWSHLSVERLVAALPPGSVLASWRRRGSLLVDIDDAVTADVRALGGSVTEIPPEPVDSVAGVVAWSAMPSAPTPTSLGLWLVRTVGPAAVGDFPRQATVLGFPAIDTALVAFVGDLAAAMAGRRAVLTVAPFPAELKVDPLVRSAREAVVVRVVAARPELRRSLRVTTEVIPSASAERAARHPTVVAVLSPAEASFTYDARTLGVAVRPSTPDPWDGAGETIAVADDGLVTGDREPNVPRVQLDHQDLATAVSALDDWAKDGDAADGPSGHGTHVAGILVGRASRTPGLVPAAKVLFQAIGRGTEQPYYEGARMPDPTHLPAMLDDAYTRGARVHTNSWMTTSPYYQEPARVTDLGCWTHPELVVVAASGNLVGTAINGVRNPAVAVNALAVGALDGEDGVWDGTAVGAAKRPKPELWAPGVNILSTVPSTTAPSGYAAKSGTSMATPAVAAAVVKVRQWLRQRAEVRAPSAALVKALLVHHARPVGGLASRHGFGRVALDFLADPAPAFRDGVDVKVAQGATRVYRMRATVGVEVTVTLCWTDPPAVGYTGTTQSRLLLTVGDGRTLSEGDAGHSIQRVTFTPASSPVTVTVRAVKVAQVTDAAAVRARNKTPWKAGSAQNFALVVSGRDLTDGS